MKSEMQILRFYLVGQRLERYRYCTTVTDFDGTAKIMTIIIMSFIFRLCPQQVLINFNPLWFFVLLIIRHLDRKLSCFQHVL